MGQENLENSDKRSRSYNAYIWRVCTIAAFYKITSVFWSCRFLL